LYLVVSICEHGSLIAFLKKKKALPLRQQLSILDKLKMALDVAHGMAHIAEGHFVHRDLAARNVLVNTMLACQVADFGLSRQVAASSLDSAGIEEEYYRSVRGQFAVRWTAPEAMQTNKFTTMTDVGQYATVWARLMCSLVHICATT
jgi:serine/threonine protein kinase